MHSASPDSLQRELYLLLSAASASGADYGQKAAARLSFRRGHTGEPEALLHTLKNTNTYLLREYEQDDTERDPLADALDMAQAVGVDVSFTGRFPGEEAHRRVLAAAITECAANTVKHAGGDMLLVTLRDTDGELQIVLQGNGVQPQETVRASGGLASLRTVVENEHGTMETPLLPAYRVEIQLPKFKG